MTFLVVVVLVTLARRHVAIPLRDALPQLLVLFSQFLNTCCQRLNLLGHLHWIKWGLMNLDPLCRLNGRAMKICMIQIYVTIDCAKLMKPETIVNQ